jgi:hypothetical protein
MENVLWNLACGPLADWWRRMMGRLRRMEGIEKDAEV